MAFIVAVSIVALFSAFKIGEISQEFKAESIDVERVNNYCAGKGRAKTVEVRRNKMKINCGNWSEVFVR